jgi:hypothetical protein
MSGKGKLDDGKGPFSGRGTDEVAKGGIGMDEKTGSWIVAVLLFLCSLIPSGLAKAAGYPPAHPTVWAFMIFFWAAAIAVILIPYIRGSSGSPETSEGHE